MIETRRVAKEELLGDLFPKFADYFRAMGLERFPEEKPWSDERLRLIFGNSSDTTVRYMAFEDGKVAGASVVSKMGEGAHGSFTCSVAREERGRGIGKQLAGITLRTALVEGYETCCIETHDDLGSKLALSIGGTETAKQSTRTLDFSGIDWDMADSWISDAQGDNSGLNLTMQNVIHECQIDELAKVLQEIDRELDRLNRQAIEKTLESMVEAWKRRQAEAKARGARHFYLIATLEGEIAGYTHCVIYDTDPTFVTQGMTAVPQKFRNRGLGKLLKAKMLVHLKNDAPEARVVRTTNNDLNAPMVSINDRLGFIKGATFTSFAFDISKAVEALKPKA